MLQLESKFQNQLQFGLELRSWPTHQWVTLQSEALDLMQETDSLVSSLMSSRESALDVIKNDHIFWFQNPFGMMLEPFLKENPTYTNFSYVHFSNSSLICIKFGPEVAASIYPPTNSISLYFDLYLNLFFDFRTSS